MYESARDRRSRTTCGVEWGESGKGWRGRKKEGGEEKIMNRISSKRQDAIVQQNSDTGWYSTHTDMHTLTHTHILIYSQHTH